MCDTLGFIGSKNSLFAKNSDRSPNEPQIIEFIPSRINTEKELKVTYITIPQVEKTHAVLLSRPTWMWGAEIGVNDCGVCIGNEAVWTKGKYSSSGLTGMDMLRLALERSSSAEEARDTIINLLEQYGQGGNCGYDHEFFYDNSFLIMDRNNLFVLETCARKWVWKKENAASISNRLSVGDNADKYSDGRPYDFAKKHSDILYNFASGSSSRKNQTGSCLNRDNINVLDMFKILRTHRENVYNPFSKGTVGSTCMHFGGLVGDHTTASMVVELDNDRITVWTTGTSTPCVSLFKPWQFGTENNIIIRKKEEYWYENEVFRRRLLCHKIPENYYFERDSLEEKWAAAVASKDNDIQTSCFDDEKAFLDKWENYNFENVNCTFGFTKRWAKKNTVFEYEKSILV